MRPSALPARTEPIGVRSLPRRAMFSGVRGMISSTCRPVDKVGIRRCASRCLLDEPRLLPVQLLPGSASASAAAASAARRFGFGRCSAAAWARLRARPRLSGFGFGRAAFFLGSTARIRSFTCQSLSLGSASSAACRFGLFSAAARLRLPPRFGLFGRASFSCCGFSAAIRSARPAWAQLHARPVGSKRSVMAAILPARKLLPRQPGRHRRQPARRRPVQQRRPGLLSLEIIHHGDLRLE
jgi:hypothetical protein